MSDDTMYIQLEADERTSRQRDVELARKLLPVLRECHGTGEINRTLAIKAGLNEDDVFNFIQRVANRNWNHLHANEEPAVIDAVAKIVDADRQARADALDAALEHQRALTDAVNPVPTPASAVCTAPTSPLPMDSAERKAIPLWEGVLAYFPAALIAAARVSKLGNDKHNPGEPLHHARGKSTDHTDCIARHLVDYQALKATCTDPTTGQWGSCEPICGPVAQEHLGNLAWRVLAYVQQELEELGHAPLAPRAKKAVTK